MLTEDTVNAMKAHGRTVRRAVQGDRELGPLMNLPGTWSNEPDLVGRGWNMIALPYKTKGKVVQPNTPDQQSDFRLLLNQYNETLTFTTLDTAVPNRGAAVAKVFDRDQHLAALQYIQHVRQIAAEDAPPTPDTPDTPKGPSSPTQAIHHEPGLLLHMGPPLEDGPDIARLATVPHGDSVLALARSTTTEGPPNLADPALKAAFSPLPIGAGLADVDANGYLAPYKKFRDHPFKGIFNPVDPLDPLRKALAGVRIRRTTTLSFDTAVPTGGILNTPFVAKQAAATSLHAVFWIEELDGAGPGGKPQFMLQYAQRVILEFFPATRGGGLIKWPHISINTMKFIGP